MTDERLLRSFHELNQPVDPDRAFADRLYADLVADLGLRRQPGAAGSLADALRRALGFDRPSVRPAATRRLLYLAATLALLLALAVALALVGARLTPRPSPLELVRLSQAAWADPPAVRFTMQDQMGTTAVESDGKGTWRSASWDLAPGSYFLYDGVRTGMWDAPTRTWTVVPVQDGGPPFPFNDEFSWVRMSFPGLVATMTPIPCDDAVDRGVEQVRGRNAAHLACPGEGLDYWLDARTHLTLQLRARSGTFYSDLGDAGDSVTAVSSFEEVPNPDPGAFSWAGPRDTGQRTGAIPGTNLVAGKTPPDWSGTAVDGAPFSTASLPGPAAIMFTDIGRLADQRAFPDAVARHPGVTAVVAAMEDTGTALGFLGRHPLPATVIADPALALWNAWGMSGYPVIVLLGADGRVVDMVSGRLPADDMDAVLGALEASDPIPLVGRFSPEPIPSADPTSPSPTPGLVCTDSLVTCLREGTRVPAWSGERLEGGTVRSDDLLGKPLVVWFRLGVCEGTCPSWVFDGLRRYARLLERYGDRATFVTVTSAERLPGDTAAQLAEAGVDIPVVFDWDGSVSEAFDLITGGSVVLDGAGRVAGQAQESPDSEAMTATIASTLDRLLGESPSP